MPAAGDLPHATYRYKRSLLGTVVDSPHAFYFPGSYLEAPEPTALCISTSGMSLKPMWRDCSCAQLFPLNGLRAERGLGRKVKQEAKIQAIQRALAPSRLGWGNHPGLVGLLE